MSIHKPIPVFIIMGTCGCGKTTIGQQISQLLGCPFVEGDAFHPKSNVEKMSKGIPLTDDDRWEWLRTIRDEYVKRAHEMSELQENDARVIIATCSALRKVYRDILREVPAKVCSVTFVYLKGTYELILSRIMSRKEHFMGSHMLKSQWETLEVPDYHYEDVIIEGIEEETHTIVMRLASVIRKRIHES